MSPNRSVRAHCKLSKARAKSLASAEASMLSPRSWGLQALPQALRHCQTACLCPGLCRSPFWQADLVRWCASLVRKAPTVPASLPAPKIRWRCRGSKSGTATATAGRQG